MNKTERKRNRFPKFLWAICLVMVMVLCHAQQAYAASPGEVTLEASNYSELINAIIKSEDGAVITITGTIEVPPGTGLSSNKILKRGNADARIDFQYGEPEFPTVVENLTFDGGSINSQYQYVAIKSNTTFINVTFQNCFTSYIGGAVYISNGIVNFKDCIFDGNKALNGGHILVTDTATINIDNCILKNGQASSHGGAICCVRPTTTCNIISSIITENSAGDYAGGVSNNGVMTITDTKIYNNSAVNGGSDIGNRTDGVLNLTDSLDTLVELFKDDGIVPKGWVCDYDFEAGLFIPDVDPSAPNSLLKLDYEVLPTAVVLDSSSLGVAGNCKITGIESGKYYKVTADGVISYVKSDGTLTVTESEASTLTGTEIIGLINGKTYKVEEYTQVPPTPTTVILDSLSLGTAGDGKIMGLTAGKKYKVSVDGTTSYVKIDGTLTSVESESGTLTGTEIVGLTNGKTYKVEVYAPVPTPTPDPEPVTPPSSNHNGGGSSHSSYTPPVVTPTVPVAVKTPAVLSSGKAILDTTKTEYLLGYTDGLLGNKDTVTKAQLAQIVYRLLTPESKAAVYSEKNSFKDVASNAWYNEAVSSMANAGLISVGADGKFNPDKNVTWSEMVTILAKFVEPNSKRKIITRHWAKDALNTAISWEFIDYNDQFNPDGEVTRVEMLNFINAMFTWTKR